MRPFPFSVYDDNRAGHRSRVSKVTWTDCFWETISREKIYISISNFHLFFFSSSFAVLQKRKIVDFFKKIARFLTESSGCWESRVRKEGRLDRFDAVIQVDMFRCYKCGCVLRGIFFVRERLTGCRFELHQLVNRYF